MTDTPDDPKRIAQFDWPALNGYLGRTLAEELTVPDDNWLTVRDGDPGVTGCSVGILEGPLYPEALSPKTGGNAPRH